MLDWMGARALDRQVRRLDGRSWAVRKLEIEVVGGCWIVFLRISNQFHRQKL